MAKRKTDLGLGRGLNALLGDPELPAQGEGSISLPISQVEPGLNQPRKRFDPETLSDLAESIRVHGIIQPLTVRRLASGYYQIIAGERRWRAAKQAGLTEVPAVIIEADDRKVMELGLIENLQREDLNPAEEARGYQVLMEEYGMTQEQVAEEMGKSRPAIANTLRLLALPEDLLKLVEDGGFLVTCSCSHFMDPELFAKTIREAAHGAHKRLRQVYFGTQCCDHPILWAADESYYLKFYVFQVVDEM